MQAGNMKMNSQLQTESFYPLSISLLGKSVIIFGGDTSAYLELLRLMDAGARATVVAPIFAAEIMELQEVHGERIELKRMNQSQFMERFEISANCSLIFSFSASESFNELLTTAANAAGVPVFVESNSGRSGFVPVTTFKRGHLKIAVSSDGICEPFEANLVQRIEELFVNDLDRYSLFLAAVNERLNDNHVTKQDLLQSQELMSALSRNNLEEALKIIDMLGDAVAGENDSDSAGEES
jgi:precorrin-2 dehydrogenase/sirohydrochlorin ferrochelatase